ncbi:MAG: hypothetical protein CMM47_02665 [Rhodospirillaceae bacterium]|nr:hypothetical protein [Rhodospirillaceae bacterium]
MFKTITATRSLFQDENALMKDHTDELSSAEILESTAALRSDLMERFIDLYIKLQRLYLKYAP